MSALLLNQGPWCVHGAWRPWVPPLLLVQPYPVDVPEQQLLDETLCCLNDGVRFGRSM